MSNTAELKCPMSNTYYSEKKTSFEPLESKEPYKVDESGIWHIYNYDIARVIMRSKYIRQSGLGAKLMHGTPELLKIKDPILYLEGEAHKKYRRNTAKFFTPKKTDTAYRQMMKDITDDLLNEFKQKGSAELSELSLMLSMKVAATVLGLTNSAIAKMAKRLNKIFRLSGKITEFSFHPSKLLSFAKVQLPVLQFYVKDVVPAIKARKKELREDVISYLIEQDYSNQEILVECLTFAAAGMVTTREFVLVNALHFFNNKELLNIYLSSNQKERYKILEEVLRIEPVVSYLERTTTNDIMFEWASNEVTIPTGSEIFLHISSINFNTETVGINEKQVCPNRNFQKKAPSYMYSFGDGNHKCPGAYIAIQESDIFLKQLFSIENIKLESTPNITYTDMIKGYEIRNFKITV